MTPRSCARRRTCAACSPGSTAAAAPGCPGASRASACAASCPGCTRSRAAGRSGSSCTPGSSPTSASRPGSVSPRSTYSVYFPVVNQHFLQRVALVLQRHDVVEHRHQHPRKVLVIHDPDYQVFQRLLFLLYVTLFKSFLNFILYYIFYFLLRISLLISNRLTFKLNLFLWNLFFHRFVIAFDLKL